MTQKKVRITGIGIEECIQRITETIWFSTEPNWPFQRFCWFL